MPACKRFKLVKRALRNEQRYRLMHDAHKLGWEVHAVFVGHEKEIRVNEDAAHAKKVGEMGFKFISSVLLHMAKVCVLRLGHRIGRDQRVTTHVFLVARALGANEGVLCGDEDASVVEGIARVCKLWGGDFAVQQKKDWKGFLGERKKAGWKVAHLTMYGTDFEKGAKKLASSKKNVVVVVGAGKVPTEAYRLADFNLAAGNQPHSEVAALALFLDRFFVGKKLRRNFRGRLRIVPSARGKRFVGKN